MDCLKYRVLIESQLESELLEVDRIGLKRHLGVCECCQKYQAELLLLQDGLRNLPIVNAPPEFTSELLARLPQQKSKALFRPYLSPRIRVLGATAALVLLLGSPLYMLVESPRPVVESTDLSAQFHIIDNTVVVPEGVIVKGDVRVYNGILSIKGQVSGKVSLISSGYSMDSDGAVEGGVEVLTWSWLERLRFGLVQIRQDVKSYVRGAWK